MKSKKNQKASGRKKPPEKKRSVEVDDDQKPPYDPMAGLKLDSEQLKTRKLDGLELKR